MCAMPIAPTAVWLIKRYFDDSVWQTTLESPGDPYFFDTKISRNLPTKLWSTW